MKYRKEIDGLRAIAIIPVVLYHAGLDFFSGGFVGVDVFFVISGYLIASIIIKDLDSAEFSIAKFYERRFRRIFPALWVMSLTCFVFGYFYISPSDMQDLSKSLIRTFLFISNIYFYKHSGYFDLAAELKPLIHTWSLSIEEQYYIFFPAILMLLHRHVGKKYIAPIIAFVMVCGLMLSQYMLASDQLGSYYLIQSRGWELLLGAVIAVQLSHRPEVLHFKKKIFAELASILGLFSIFFSAIYFNKQTLFPGLAALVPTLGAALVIIYANEGTLVANLLGRKPFVFVGLISYSLYLWHQPILSFARITIAAEPSAHTVILLVAAAFIMAYISWRFVESPFRDYGRVKKKVFKMLVLTGLIVVVVLGNWGAVNGLKSRFNTLYSNHPQLLGAEKPINCRLQSHSNKSDYDLCVFGDESSSTTIALWGDSHAAMLISALDEKFKVNHIKGVRVLAKGCDPIPGIQEEDFLYVLQKKRSECASKYASIYSYLDKNVKGTIVSIRWTSHLYPIPGFVDRMLFDNQEGGVEPGKSRRQIVLDSENRIWIDGDLKRQEIYQFLDFLAQNQKYVVLVYPVPEVGWNVPRATLQKLILNDEANIQDVTTSYALYRKRNKFVNEVLDQWNNGLIYRIKPDEVLCGHPEKDRCYAQFEGVSYYSDDNHLSYAGSVRLAEKIAAAVRE